MVGMVAAFEGMMKSVSLRDGGPGVAVLGWRRRVYLYLYLPPQVEDFDVPGRVLHPLGLEMEVPAHVTDISAGECPWEATAAGPLT